MRRIPRGQCGAAQRERSRRAAGAARVQMKMANGNQDDNGGTVRLDPVLLLSFADNKGLSRQDLAKRAGVGREVVDMALARKWLSLEDAEKLAAALAVTVKALQRVTEATGPRKTVVLDRGKLVKLRVDKGWSQRQMVEEGNGAFSRDSLKRAEHGEAISWKIAKAICEVLGVEMGELVERHARVYRYPSGRFEQAEDGWVEYRGDEEIASFEHFDEDESFLFLVCRRRRGEGDRRMIVRIPNGGGDMEWTWENPLEWQVFNHVKADWGA